MAKVQKVIWNDKFPKENIYFQMDNGILYYADCLQMIKKFPEKIFDAVITDPPYGITACKWDAIIPFNKMWKELKRIRKDNTPIILFGHEPFSSLLRISNLKEYKYDWYWEKEKGTGAGLSSKQPLRKVENILVFYKKQPYYNSQGDKLDKPYKHVLPLSKNIGNFNISSKNINDYGNRIYRIYTHKKKHNLLYFARDSEKYHPTQKPVALLRYLIETYTKENDLVLDFTCGSGTTLIACEELNRKWIGVEIEKKYCEIAKKRILKTINKKKLKLF